MAMKRRCVQAKMLLGHTFERSLCAIMLCRGRKVWFHRRVGDAMSAAGACMFGRFVVQRGCSLARLTSVPVAMCVLQTNQNTDYAVCAQGASRLRVLRVLRRGRV